MKKILFFAGLALIAVWFLSRPVPAPERVDYGVTFSAPYARDVLGLDWRRAYSSVLDDLGAKRIRLSAYWNEYEAVQGKYDFSGLDLMIREAGKRNAEIILAIGQKLPRWPECHIPLWAARLSRQDRNAYFLKFFEEVIKRYRGNEHIRYWQVENEPFLAFGECMGYDRRLLDVEISRLKALDDRPVVVTDSGELSIWAPAYSRSDVFGTTMYRTVWNKYTGTFTYPLPPGYFRMKARLMELLYGKKTVIVVELQAEPWNPLSPPDTELGAQERLMNVDIFKEHIEYERAAGFQEVYLWGVEWWYWLKEKHGKPELWDEARKLFGAKEKQ